MRWQLALGAGLGLALMLGGRPAQAEAHLTLETPQLHLEHAPPRLLDAHLDLSGLQRLSEVPLDLGGGSGREGIRSDPATRQVLAFILGFIPGFGLGHLLAGSKDGFVLFLIVDVVLLTADILICSFAPDGICALGWLAWVVEHVFEGYDAYTTAGGEKVVENSVESLMHPDTAEACRATPRFAPALRTFSFEFSNP